jgi:hypothetical protein
LHPKPSLKSPALCLTKLLSNALIACSNLALLLLPPLNIVVNLVSAAAVTLLSDQIKSWNILVLFSKGSLVRKTYLLARNETIARLYY